MRKMYLLILVLAMVPALSGCFALLAGAGGTALWQAGKVISEETTSMERAVGAVETTFKKEGIKLEDKVIKRAVTQLRGKDESGTKVAVDIFSKGEKQSKIEIRYGIGEETPARELLNKIKRRL